MSAIQRRRKASRPAEAVRVWLTKAQTRPGDFLSNGPGVDVVETDAECVARTRQMRKGGGDRGIPASAGTRCVRDEVRSCTQNKKPARWPPRGRVGGAGRFPGLTLSKLGTYWELHGVPTPERKSRFGVSVV